MNAGQTAFVPPDFVVPQALRAATFTLEPLGVQHNEADYDAWQSSIEHISSTPGFVGRNWPDAEMTIRENLGDCKMHAEHFEQRIGFTYTVLDPADGNVIGCVYIYPLDDERHAEGARIRSWVRMSHAALDSELCKAVYAWVQREWPFRRVEYEGRP